MIKLLSLCHDVQHKMIKVVLTVLSLLKEKQDLITCSILFSLRY